MSGSKDLSMATTPERTVNTNPAVGIDPEFREKSDTMYGRLLEGAHITGYSMERAIRAFEWLIDDGRWRTVGPGFDDIAAFVASVDLSEFRVSLERRKALSRKLAALAVPQRTTAKMLGVSAGTVAADVKPAQNRAAPTDQAPDGDANGGAALSSERPPPFASTSGEQAAKAAAKAAARDTKRAEKRERVEAEREALADRSVPLAGERFTLLAAAIEHADIAPASIDCIITDPPYPQEFVPLYRTLAERAVEWLKPGGSLVVMSGQTHFPQVLANITSVAGLSYQWTAAYLTPGGQAVQVFPRKVNTFWKPLVWLVKGEYGGDWIGDVCRSATNDNDKRFHGWGQSESGMLDIVGRFSKSGDTILDPFAGGGATGMAALALGRRFIGCDIDETTLRVTAARLQEAADAALVA